MRKEGRGERGGRKMREERREIEEEVRLERYIIEERDKVADDLSPCFTPTVVAKDGFDGETKPSTLGCLMPSSSSSWACALPPTIAALVRGWLLETDTLLRSRFKPTSRQRFTVTTIREREGRREGGREGGRERGREREREGEREGGRERGREGG